jgi:membrane protease YdiL (CAAX protease family)
MYLVGFPLFYIIIKKMPIRKREKKKLSALEFLYVFLAAEAFMTAGNFIGQSLNATISTLLGKEIENSVSELILNSPPLLIFIVAVIIAPIIEELLFRKFMIDRISQYGDLLAIIVSGVAFGLFHGNFYQFFYAAFLGILLGYVYTKTGNVKYTVAIHMIINFIGSVAVLPLLKYEEILLSGAIPETGAMLREYFFAIMVTASYSVIQYAFAISGVVVFVNAIRYRLIKVNRNPQIKIPNERVAGAVLGNVGTILFIVLSLVLFGVNIFLG